VDGCKRRTLARLCPVRRFSPGDSRLALAGRVLEGARLAPVKWASIRQAVTAVRRLPDRRIFKALLAIALGMGIAHTTLAEDWRSQVTDAPPGKFPDLPSIRLHYTFGWSNVIQAAHAEATIARVGNEYRTKVTGGTDGLARALWMLDAQHSALVQAGSDKPVRISQVERYRKRTIETLVRYDAKGLERLRRVTPSPDKAVWKRVNFSPIYDVIGGVLYVRSQPLKVGDSIGVVSFPGDSPYLTLVQVIKRETIRCMGRDWPALRLSLQIRKLTVRKDKPDEAVEYAKFHSGTVWISDDALRIPLRAEVHVFVGFVYGQLQSYEKL